MFTRDTIDDGFSLTTPRLALRWPRLADGAAIEHLAGRKSVADMTALVPHPYPAGAADAFIFASRLANARGDGLTLAITPVRKPKELLGVVAIQPAAFSACADCPLPFLGFWLGVEFWGKGYATEAVTATLSLAFREIDTPAISAETLTGNVAGQRVLAKSGFVTVGSGLAPYPARGGLLPAHRLIRQRRAGEVFWRDAAPARAATMQDEAACAIAAE